MHEWYLVLYCKCYITDADESSDVIPYIRPDVCTVQYAQQSYQFCIICGILRALRRSYYPAPWYYRTAICMIYYYQSIA